MAGLTDLWCLCWSQRQNALHIEQLGKHLSSNRQAYADNAAGDYRLLAVDCRAGIDMLARNLQGTLAARESVRTVAFV
ncbi:MAG: hypothetical protein HY855_02860 [Burkholderiales bacterium]|nr:hypothetical protein [Burkholderiales bacterium]